MKVGILGSGDVAKALAGGFLKHGHEVMMGTREPAKLADWGRSNPNARLGSFADAAKFCELAVLAVKGSAAAEALRAAGARTLAGKTGDRRHQSARRCAADERRAQVLHQPRRIADGAAAEGVSGGALRQGVQLGGQCADGQPRVCGREADHVHLRQRRRRRRTRRRGSSVSSAGKPRTWARSRLPARSSRSACSGASPVSCATSGRTRSSC